RRNVYGAHSRERPTNSKALILRSCAARYHLPHAIHRESTRRDAIHFLDATLDSLVGRAGTSRASRPFARTMAVPPRDGPDIFLRVFLAALSSSWIDWPGRPVARGRLPEGGRRAYERGALLVCSDGFLDQRERSGVDARLLARANCVFIGDVQYL